jgi:hypothetical protein
MNITLKDVFIIMVQAVFMVVVFGNVFFKAGFSRWYSILLAVPIANLIVIIWFSFTEWPIEEELLKLRLTTTKLTDYGLSESHTPW